jgi:exopolysaccharide biosynthesis polyprenyl glycosylphosphotransferase
MYSSKPFLWGWFSVDILIPTLAAFVSLLPEYLLDGSDGLSYVLAQRISIKNFTLMLLFLIIWTGIHQLMGLYAIPPHVQRRILALQTMLASLLGSAFFFLFPLFSHERRRPAYVPVLLFWTAASVISLIVRLMLWPRIREWRRGKTRQNRTIIVGSGPFAVRCYTSLLAARPSQHRILGFVDSPGPHAVTPLVKERLLGDLTQLDTILMQTAVDEVIIALPIRSCYDAAQNAIHVCENGGVPVGYYAQPFHHAAGVSYMGERALQPFLSWYPSRVAELQVLKTFLDLLGASVLLCLLSPLLLLIAIAIVVTSPGPPVFVQERYGLNKQRFRMLKFRTMVDGAEKLQKSLEDKNEVQGPAFKIRNDPRITPVGRFLRKTSLDELPQLINVIKGDMSLVGPRPLPARDVERFNHSWLMRRFSVKPGMTCLWQICGRSNTSFERWIAYDLEYIDNWSPLLDIKILFRTIPAVVRGSGAV